MEELNTHLKDGTKTNNTECLSEIGWTTSILLTTTKWPRKTTHTSQRTWKTWKWKTFGTEFDIRTSAGYWENLPFHRRFVWKEHPLIQHVQMRTGVSAHHTAQSGHISSREHAWLKIASHGAPETFCHPRAPDSDQKHKLSLTHLPHLSSSTISFVGTRSIKTLRRFTAEWRIKLPELDASLNHIVSCTTTSALSSLTSGSQVGETFGSISEETCCSTTSSLIPFWEDSNMELWSWWLVAPLYTPTITTTTIFVVQEDSRVAWNKSSPFDCDHAIIHPCVPKPLPRETPTWHCFAKTSAYLQHRQIPESPEHSNHHAEKATTSLNGQFSLIREPTCLIVKPQLVVVPPIRYHWSASRVRKN